eukprot:20427-Pelagococcus_subviridis.AAC.7
MATASTSATRARSCATSNASLHAHRGEGPSWSSARYDAKTDASAAMASTRGVARRSAIFNDAAASRVASGPRARTTASSTRLSTHRRCASSSPVSRDATTTSEHPPRRRARWNTTRTSRVLARSSDPPACAANAETADSSAAVGRDGGDASPYVRVSSATPSGSTTHSARGMATLAAGAERAAE